MPLTSKEMIKKLKKNGFAIVSQNGSHVKMFNATTNTTVIIPYHSKELKKGLEQAILRQAGIREEK
jgi:predicted RNA binding protein YcfA (HicA-like mRNA interferase family)